MYFSCSYYRLVGASLPSIEAYQTGLRQLVQRPQEIRFRAMGQACEFAYGFRPAVRYQSQQRPVLGGQSLAPASSD